MKFAYVVPSFANPTGETLSLAARERLLDLAAELDIPIIEDAAYAMLRFEGEPLPPIMALEIERRGSIERARVIYCGTFSKVLSPGLRVGWIVAPKPLIRRLVLDQAGLRPQQLDLQPDGHAPHGGGCIRRAGGAALRPLSPTPRRDAGRARAAHAEGRELDAPQGGLFVWLCLPRGPRRCAAAGALAGGSQRGLRAGRGVLLRRPSRNTLRLSYSLPGEAQIEEGIARLARLI